MAPGFEDRESNQNTTTTREALVDITAEPAQPTEPQQQLKLGRRRLSDVQGQTEDPPSETKVQRRALSDVAPSDASEPAPAPQPAPSGRPRISIGQPRTALVDMPVDASHPSSTTEHGVPDSAHPGLVTLTKSPLDPAKIQQWIADLRSKQCLPIAAVGGLLAAVVGAMIWAVISVTTNYQIGWMAVGVGFLVGGATRVLGRGLDKSFGYLGAALALFGCLLGNYLTNCMFIAREVGLSATSVMTQIDPAAIPRLMFATFHPMDILFYGLAVYEGYRFSFRRITEAQVAAALQKA